MSDQLYCLEVSGELDRTTAEALRLEIGRLAKRCGLDLEALRIEALRIETPEESTSG
jgi:hypothetical protein